MRCVGADDAENGQDPWQLQGSFHQGVSVTRIFTAPPQVRVNRFERLGRTHTTGIR